VAVVPTRPGQLTLPAITLKWWDTVSGQMRETRLDAQTVNVVAAKNIASGRTPTQRDSPEELAASQTENTQTASATRWWWLLVVSNGVFVLLTLVFALLWWRQRSKPGQPAGHTSQHPEQETERAAFERIRHNPPHQLAELRDAILHWARIFWHKPHLKTLAEVVAVSGCSELATHFAALDKHLYGAGASTDDVDSRAITEILATLRTDRDKNPRTGAGSLPPLYPGQ